MVLKQEIAKTQANKLDYHCIIPSPIYNGEEWSGDIRQKTTRLARENRAG
jgi:hypothetical protein